MSLISGGIYDLQNKRVDKIRSRLIEGTRSLIDGVATLHNCGEFFLIGGKQKNTSKAELAHGFADQKSYIAGRVFTRDMKLLDPHVFPLERINQTKGKWLGENYWGRYILISFDEQKKSVTLYRDPQGLSTLFYLYHKGAFFFSTDIFLLYDALDMKPELNFDYLASFVVSAHNVTTATPFNDIQELHPGAATELAVEGTVFVREFWDPTAIAPSWIHDETVFQENLYTTYVKCAQAWVSDTEKVCIELSGGLDSSSIVSVLREIFSDNDISALTMFHSAIASSNEVTYAQEVANVFNVPLKTFDSRTTMPFSSKDFPQRLNRPTTAILNYNCNQEVVNSLGSGWSGEFVSGQGGDHLFMALPFIESIADYIIDKRFKGMAKKCADISSFYRMPYGSLIGKTIRTLFRYGKSDCRYLLPTFTFESWMNDRFKEHAKVDLFKPLFWNKLKNVRPGKAQHILSIYQAPLYVDYGYRILGRPALNPLLSQPLVELALSVPTYQAMVDGWDRILFRRAMSKYSQGSYMWRKSKGETSGIIILGIRKNFSNVCELVMDGRFAERGLVDKTILMKNLTELKHGKVDGIWHILNLAVAELWLKSWSF
jgi:asparagine synthase (glutamine-hydrolysing)